MIQFFKGPKKGYSLKEHKNGIYFATDTKEIISNGYSYVGPIEEKKEEGWLDVVGSIEEAFSQGGMVTLKENKEVSSPLIVKSGVNAVLDLGNCSLTYTNVATSKNWPIEVEKGASLTIRGEGVINGGSGSDNLALCVYGDCKIESGTFTVGPDAKGQGNACVEVNGGNLEISGGVFSTEFPYGGSYYVLNKKNGSDSVISCTGGMFINYDPSNSKTENPAQDFVANGYKAVRIEGTENYQVIKVK